MNQLDLLTPDTADATPVNLRDVPYTLVQNSEALADAVGAIAQFGVFALDIETTAFDCRLGTVRLIQIAVPEHPVVIVDVQAVGLEQAQHHLNPLFSSGVKKVIQNAKFEISWLLHHGFDLRGPVFDTMLAQQLLTCGHYSPANLQALVDKYLGELLPKDNQGSDWSGPLTDDQLRYAARDASVLLDLRDSMIPKLNDAGLLEVAKIEFDAVFALAQMETTGLYFDWGRVQHLTNDLVAQRDAALTTFVDELDQALVATTGIALERDLTGAIAVNPNSPTQLLKIFKSMGMPVDTLSQNQLKLLWDKYPLLKTYLAWKELQTAVTKAEKLPEHKHPVTGRVHTQFRQLGADSGRMTSSDPNVQNLPRAADFRSCVTPAPGYKLVIADYSQIELRIAAQLAPDERMLKAYRDGEDLHRLTAALVNDIDLEQVTKAQRQQAKAVNFGLVYGMGANGLKNYAKTGYGVDLTLEQATQFRDKYFGAYQGIKRWHKQIDTKARAQKYFYARTLSGRRRYVKPEDQRLTLLSNTPVQGLGADILKCALGMIYERLRGLDARLVNTVHDEIVIEARADIADQVSTLLSDTMVEAGQRYLVDLPVLAEAGVCDSWSEK